MIYSNFTGRVAKKAKLIDGVNGQFLSMDLAVNNYSKGEEVTQWVRVQSSDPAHLKLAEYFTKGRILTIQGNVKICFPNRGAKMRFSECQQTRLIGRA